MLAPDEVLLLRAEHARRRLGRGPGAYRAPGRCRQPPGGPDLRHRRDDRRAQLRPHLRRRRRHAPEPAETQGRHAGRAVRARRQDRLLQDREDPQGPELGPDPAVAPDRGRRQRQGRGVPHRHRRQAHRQAARHVRGARQHGREAGDSEGQRRRPRRRGAARSSSSRSQRRTSSIITTGSRGTSRRSPRPRTGKVGYIHIPNMGVDGAQRVRQAFLSRSSARRP